MNVVHKIIKWLFIIGGVFIIGYGISNMYVGSGISAEQWGSNLWNLLVVAFGVFLVFKMWKVKTKKQSQKMLDKLP